MTTRSRAVRSFAAAMVSIPGIDLFDGRARRQLDPYLHEAVALCHDFYRLHAESGAGVIRERIDDARLVINVSHADSYGDHRKKTTMTTGSLSFFTSAHPPPKQNKPS